MKVRVPWLLGLSLALGASVPGCLAPTEVTLDVSTNVLCSDLRDVAVAAGPLSDLASREISAQTDHCDEGHVGTLVLVPSGAKDQPVSFEVVAGVGRSAESCRASDYVGGCIVARRAFGFVAHRPLSLPIELELECLDVPCEATETCRGGNCISAELSDPWACTDPLGCPSSGGASSGGSGIGGVGSLGGQPDGGQSAAGGTSGGSPSAGGTVSAGGSNAVGGRNTGGTSSGGGLNTGGVGVGGSSSTGGAASGGGAGGGGSGSGGAVGVGGSGSGGAPPDLHAIEVTTLVDVEDGDVSSLGALSLQPGADGLISLREALNAANATPNATGPDEIAFQLPDSPPFVIAVAPPGLPPVLDPVVINGLSQPGVVLDGSSAGAVDGLVLSAGSDGSSVLGITVQHFAQAGVHCVGSSQHTIQGNQLGTDWTGVAPAGNNDGLVLTDCASLTIGGDAILATEFNVFSGNARNGLFIEGAGSSGNVVRGNLVGVGGDGSTPVPNQHGIHLRTGASGNLIGGSFVVRNTVSANRRNGIRIIDSGTDSNVIQANNIGVDRANSPSTLLGNGWVGIRVTQGPVGNLIGGDSPSVGNNIRNNDGGVGIDTLGPKDNAVIGNSISGNLALGIDLGTDNTVTPNDPGDTDNGANDALNFPDVSSVVYSGGQATVSFDLDVPAGDYRVEFFANSAPHSSLYGEGALFLFATSLAHAGSGVQSYQATFSCTSTDWLTLTTTELLSSSQYGSTSEFSLAVPTTYTR